MATDNPNQGRTIEDIERRAAAITIAEFAAMTTLADCFREFAERHPTEGEDR